VDDVSALVTTRLASLSLARGRPRRLTYDDRMVRAALVVDLAIGGALSEDEESVALDQDRAAALGLGEVAGRLAATGGSLSAWIGRGPFTFEEWERRLVEAGVWVPHRRMLLLRYADVHRERTEADRALGRRPRRDELPPTTLAVLALGRVSGLFGRPDPRHGGDGWSGAPGEPPSWVLAGMGEASWAGGLAVDALLTVGTHTRAVGNAVD
jgi:hypothetical protein